MVEYDNPDDVDLAIVALNGFVCGQNVIRVQKLGGQAQQAAPKAQPVAATAMSNSMTQKIVSNPVLAMQVKQGREVGSRPTTIVQLLNAVYQEDLMDDRITRTSPPRSTRRPRSTGPCREWSFQSPPRT